MFWKSKIAYFKHYLDYMSYMLLKLLLDKIRLGSFNFNQ